MFNHRIKASFTVIITAVFIFSLCASAHAQTETLTLKPGFNFISFKAANGMKPEDFKKLDPAIENIYSYDSKISTFFSHNDGDAFELTRGKGYIVKTNSTADITISLPA